jgi:hypothetical protein
MQISERGIMRGMRYILLLILVLPAILWSKYGSIDPCEILRQELSSVTLVPGEYNAETQIYFDSFAGTSTGKGCISGVFNLAWIRM